MNSDEEKEIAEWVGAYFNNGSNNKNLIASLLAMQEKFGYLPRSGMKLFAEHLGISAANVYSVATFYNQFRFVPPGKYHIKVCMGTACAIKGGDLILDQWERDIGIEAGQVTEDREYSIERVACVGCCSLAPVTVIGDDVIPHMSATKVDGILTQHKIARETAERKAAKKESE